VAHRRAKVAEPISRVHLKHENPVSSRPGFSLS
jgi:hypothetical protein